MPTADDDLSQKYECAPPPGIIIYNNTDDTRTAAAPPLPPSDDDASFVPPLPALTPADLEAEARAHEKCKAQFKVALFLS
jgi:hypothetical protein